MFSIIMSKMQNKLEPIGPVITSPSFQTKAEALVLSRLTQCRKMYDKIPNFSTLEVSKTETLLENLLSDFINSLDNHLTGLKEPTVRVSPSFKDSGFSV